MRASFLGQWLRRMVGRLTGGRIACRPQPSERFELRRNQLTSGMERADFEACESSVEHWGLVIWSEHGRTWGRRVADIEVEEIWLDDRRYERITEDCDLFYGLLKEPSGKVIGFDVHVIDDPRLPRSRFGAATEGVRVRYVGNRPSDLIVTVDPSMVHENTLYEATEGFPVHLLKDERDEFLLYFGCLGIWVGPPSTLGFATLDPFAKNPPIRVVTRAGPWPTR